MKNFELKTWMSENRNTVISKYEEMSKNEFFSGISLKDFMSKILFLMELNNVKSEKRASSMLISLTNRVVMENTEISCLRDRDAEMSKKYANTAFMAMV